MNRMGNGDGCATGCSPQMSTRAGVAAAMTELDCRLHAAAMISLPGSRQAGNETVVIDAKLAAA